MRAGTEVQAIGLLHPVDGGRSMRAASVPSNTAGGATQLSQCAARLRLLAEVRQKRTRRQSVASASASSASSLPRNACLNSSPAGLSSIIRRWFTTSCSRTPSRRPRAGRRGRRAPSPGNSLRCSSAGRGGDEATSACHAHAEGDGGVITTPYSRRKRSWCFCRSWGPVLRDKAVVHPCLQGSPPPLPRACATGIHDAASPECSRSMKRSSCCVGSFFSTML